MTSHKVEALAIIKTHDDSDYSYWREWYGRDNRDGLKACHSRAVNLSVKYPNTRFRVNERQHDHTHRYAYYQNGQEVAADASNLMVRVKVKRIAKYDDVLRDCGNALVEDFKEYFDWLKANEKCRYMVAECNGDIGVFTAMNSRGHGTVATMQDVTDFLAAVRRERDRKELAIVPRKSTYSVSCGVLTYQQREKLCEMISAEEWQAWITGLADVFDQMVAATDRTGGAKAALEQVAVKIREAGK